jgi:hypothetical protein
MSTHRRRLKSAAPQTRATTTTVHDRRATELPKGAIVASVEVDDPYARGERITAIASLRDDPLGAWARHQIDDAKYVAGRHWQKIYEMAEIGMLRSMDPARERIDSGGNGVDALTDHRVRAMATLRNCREVLGDVGDALIRDVLGRGLCLVEVASSRGLGTRRGLEYLGQRLRECLESLAKTFGYA